MTNRDAQGKTALITGVTGQDGAYLTQFLLEERGYQQIIGLVRRTSDDMPRRRLRLPVMQDYLQDGRLVLALGDVTDLHSLVTVLDRHGPDEIYNLAAQSHVAKSFEVPEVTNATNLNGVLNIIKAVRMTDAGIRIYQASTSEMFGDAALTHMPQDELTPFLPISPYGIFKTAAHRLMAAERNRATDDPLWACSGILFNHESPIRGEEFVTRKVTQAAARWVHGNSIVLKLGYLDSQRDWGYAKDYVRAMWMILNQPVDDPRELQDYVVATGAVHAVRELVVEAFKAAGRLFGAGEPILVWRGEGEDEQLLVEGEVVVVIDPEFYRPNELSRLQGSPVKIQEELGWRPTTNFRELVELMVMADVRRVAEGVPA